MTTYTAIGPDRDQDHADHRRPARPAARPRYAYTAGTESAVGGGTEPAGLLASITAPGGGVTSYAYDSAGDVMQATNPLGLVTKYTYDNLGRELTQTQVSDTYPAGLTTSYAYDGQDRLVTETDPPVTDRVTGAVHTEVTDYTYDADADVLTTTISDATGGDPSRTTTSTYNAHGELASTTDALGNVTTYTYDALGDRISQTNPAGVTTAYAYDATGNLLTTTLRGLHRQPVQPVAAREPGAGIPGLRPGRAAGVGHQRHGHADRLHLLRRQPARLQLRRRRRAAGGKQDVTTYGYDAAGNQITETAPGGLVINTTYNADNQVASQTVDPSGVDRAVTASYDADGNVVTKTLTGGGVTQTETMTYNAMDQAAVADRSANTGGNLTTSVRAGPARPGHLARPTRRATPRTIANDEAGRPVVETGPAVAEPDRQRRRAGHGQPGHHDRLRHLRRPDRDFRPGRQRHHLRLRRRRPAGLGHRPVLHPARLQHARSTAPPRRSTTTSASRPARPTRWATSRSSATTSSATWPARPTRAAG